MNNIKDVVVTSAYIPSNYALTPITHVIEVETKNKEKTETNTKQKILKPTKK